VLRLFTENAPEYADAIREALMRLGEAPTRQPYAIPWIESLKARGLCVYYLSNYFEFLMQEAPQVLDFIPHTAGGVFSCQEKLLKPDPAIYRVLCERYGLEPSECVFIDDTQINIDAAIAFGMRGIRFESYAQASAALDAML
jgi:putative hydrolase of the HAD superfamily